ncbi:MAG: monovalent cation/H+ antiporter complex subunit F [Candidatus Thiodiazotropha endolucinida]|uniref:monovalent cation/H+ antiporter complex subunit F n=1 Tax=Candidatus Thiodiazotropha sp. LNASS1 TaxID=3096260 RepID=UPI001DAFE25A|nr:cation:proton antiporter [Candidatus Thiodiazotropha taylori]MBT3094540.1 cation:proton antiporter [Candidatus Thiodiazotropha sp. (ex Lucina pensylvanica)]MCG8025651.1 monovalent cation/H+ antiporter complex subunit F [Candidatus Thiodiazotropha endolucinida]MCU7944631.1 cation:proton antiporter [Candidatus Thiodiazotropha sp. (ex Cardiolucina cf. quadrata)]MCG7878583.1 monovalent cation/H+ antiporter complex subunit F [Candidatus Thiodiazotropha taylori]
MILTLMETAALTMLGGAVLLSLLRLLMGPTAPDRVVAADTLAVITTSGLVVLAALLGSALYLDVALIYGTLAFVGVVAIARAIEGNGS